MITPGLCWIKLALRRRERRKALLLRGVCAGSKWKLAQKQEKTITDTI